MPFLTAETARLPITHFAHRIATKAERLLIAARKVAGVWKHVIVSTRTTAPRCFRSPSLTAILEEIERL